MQDLAFGTVAMRVVGPEGTKAVVCSKLEAAGTLAVELAVAGTLAVELAVASTLAGTLAVELAVASTLADTLAVELEAAGTLAGADTGILRVLQRLAPWPWLSRCWMVSDTVSRSCPRSHLNQWRARPAASREPQYPRIFASCYPPSCAH